MLLDSYRLHYVAGADAAYYIHAGDGIAEDGVVGRQAGLVFQANEELAAIGVGASVRHRHCTGFVGASNRLVVELVAGTTSAGAGGVAALDDETRLDAVEDHAVIKAIAR